jgi:phage terminase large subunit-like protein
MLDSVGHNYALDVITGKTPAAKYVIKACQRYLTDLDTAEERGLEFKPKTCAGLHYIFSKGDSAHGRRMGWQAFRSTSMATVYLVESLRVVS